MNCENCNIKVVDKKLTSLCFNDSKNIIYEVVKKFILCENCCNLLQKTLTNISFKIFHKIYLNSEGNPPAEYLGSVPN